MLTAAIRLGDGYWLIIGPAVVAIAIALWIYMTVRADRKVPRSDRTEQATPHRGPVRGGIIEGDGGQRNASHETDFRDTDVRDTDTR